MSREILLILTTLPAADAPAVARALLEEGLAACVQAEAIRSLYRWDGRIEEAEETRLRIKADPARREALVARLAALHPYDVPEICWTPLHASDAYGAWVAE